MGENTAAELENMIRVLEEAGDTEGAARFRASLAVYGTPRGARSGRLTLSERIRQELAERRAPSRRRVVMS